VISPGTEGPESNPPGTPDTNHFLQPPFAGKWEDKYDARDLNINISGIPRFGGTQDAEDLWCNWNSFSGTILESQFSAKWNHVCSRS
jgi:hypothetical protein